MSPARRSRDRWFALLLGVGVTLLAWGATELLIARFVDIPFEPYPGGFPTVRPPSTDPILRYDPHLFWKLVPDSKQASFPHSDSLFRLATNALGLRDDPFPITEDPRTFRAVALGDSTTWGDGVSSWQTWPNQLETMLQERTPHRPVEVLNAGMIGYATLQTLRLERRLLDRFDFDLVMLANQHIDRAMTSRPDTDFVHSRPVEVLLGLLHRSGVYRLTRHLAYPPEDEPCHDPTRVTNRVPPDQFEANLREMVRLAQEDGAQVMLVLMLPECTPPTCTAHEPLEQLREPEELRALLPGREDDYRRILRELADELALPLVDVPALLEGQVGRSELWVDVVHPSPEGHRLVAGEAMKTMQQAGLLP